MQMWNEIARLALAWQRGHPRRARPVGVNFTVPPTEVIYLPSPDKVKHPFTPRFTVTYFS